MILKDSPNIIICSREIINAPIPIPDKRKALALCVAQGLFSFELLFMVSIMLDSRSSHVFVMHVIIFFGDDVSVIIQKVVSTFMDDMRSVSVEGRNEWIVVIKVVVHSVPLWNTPLEQRGFV